MNRIPNRLDLFGAVALFGVVTSVVPALAGPAATAVHVTMPAAKPPAMAMPVTPVAPAAAAPKAPAAAPAPKAPAAPAPKAAAPAPAPAKAAGG
jgi:hypothetical protein